MKSHTVCDPGGAQGREVGATSVVFVTAPVRRPFWCSQEPQYQLNSLTRRPDQPPGRRQLVRRCSMTLRIGQEEVCDLR